MFTIVGVAPAGFPGAQLGETRDVYAPMMMQPLLRPPRARYSGEMDPDLLHVRTNSWLFAMGRLKPGVSAKAAAASLAALIPEDQRPPAAANGVRPPAVELVPVATGDPVQRAQLTSVARLLMGVVGLVLLIACANVANLLLSRAAARRHEIATRLSLGASRGRLLRQLLTEAGLLAALGGASGLALAWAAIRALRAAPPPAGALPIQIDFSIDARVLGFTLALSLLTGLLFGLVPALRASRLELTSVMRDEGYVAAGGRRRVPLRNLLVVAQVAMSLVVLVAAGLFLRSLGRSQSVDPGFDVDRLLTAPLSVNLLRYTRAQGRQFYADVIERVEAVPGVESATLARWLPLSGGGSVGSLHIQGRQGSDNTFGSEGGGFTAPTSTEAVSISVVGPGYFRTLGIPLVRGRDFAATDDDSLPRVGLVNEAFVRAHFPGEDPIGRRFSRTGAQGPWIEIVGIARDTRTATLTTPATPMVYLPLRQNHETGMQLIVRSRNPAAVAAPVGRVVHELERSLPVTGIQPMSEWISVSLYAARAGARLIAGFGLLALLLASIGLYSVLTYAVTRRTRELAVRMALGARTAQLLRQVLLEGFGLVAMGIAFGLVAAYFTTRVLAAFLYEVGARDALTFAAIPLVLLLIALPACLLPARRATRVDPMVALRQS